MASTPASVRKSGRARALRGEPDLPADLAPYSAGERLLLVPRAVFPKERVPAGFRGWPARVVGVERHHADGLHVYVEFEGYSEQYHFPVDEVRRWIAGSAAQPSPAKSGRAAAGGSPAKGVRTQQQDEQGAETAAAAAEEQGEARAAPKSARKSARKPAATSSRTAATPARRRASAAARTLAATHEGPAEGEQQEAARAAAATPASKAAAVEGEAAYTAAERPSSARQRKRKHGAEGSDAAAPATRQEGEEGAAGEEREVLETSWVDRAADALRQTLYSGAAVGAAYAVLRTLYPQLEAAAP